MENLNKNIDTFLENATEGQEVCDPHTGVCYIKKPDGLIERKVIERKLMMEDGRELLREERPISNTNRKFLR